MKSLIGGEWRDAKDGKVIEVINPATGELIDTVPSLSKEEIDEAVEVVSCHCCRNAGVECGLCRTGHKGKGSGRNR